MPAAIKMTLSFLGCQLAIFAQFVRELVYNRLGLVIRATAAGKGFGLILVVVRFVGNRLPIGLVVNGVIVVVGSVRTGVGLFSNTFPVVSINGVGQV